VIDNVSIRYEIGVQNYPWWSPNFVQVGRTCSGDAHPHCPQALLLQSSIRDSRERSEGGETGETGKDRTCVSRKSRSSRLSRRGHQFATNRHE
jgi:hypothetical protein